MSGPAPSLLLSGPLSDAPARSLHLAGTVSSHGNVSPFLAVSTRPAPSSEIPGSRPSSGVRVSALQAPVPNL